MTAPLRLAALTLTLTLSSAASGLGRQADQGTPFFGLGDKTCADWTRAGQAGGAEFEAMQAWVLGYVSGAVMADYSNTGLPMPPMELVQVPTPSYMGAATTFETRPWTAAGIIRQVNSRCPYDARESLNNVANDVARGLMRHVTTSLKSN